MMNVRYHGTHPPRFGILPQRIKAAWEMQLCDERHNPRPKANPDSIYISGEVYTPPTPEKAALHHTLAQKVEKLLQCNRQINEAKANIYDTIYSTTLAAYDKLDFKYEALCDLSKARREAFEVMREIYPAEADYALEQLDQSPEHADSVISRDLLRIRKFTKAQIFKND